MDTLLKVDEISVSYGNISALRNVSVSVGSGEIVSLIGANGAGKSTFLKAIVGQVLLSGGSISYSDKLLHSCTNGRHHGIPTYRLADMGISLVPEGRHVFADLTVEENLDMGAFSVKDEKVISRRKQEMFDFFPILGARRKQKTRFLSGGEQQMMALARALMSSPFLLLLDEPGLGLAPLVIQDIFGKIRQINKENNVTVLLVEQNALMALKNSDRGFVMENGSLVLEGNASDLLTNKKVRDAYLGGEYDN